jgi:hypothetical protein
MNSSAAKTGRFLRDRERHDLVLEAAAFLRRRCLLLRGERERILLVAADVAIFGDVLGRDPCGSGCRCRTGRR